MVLGIRRQLLVLTVLPTLMAVLVVGAVLATCESKRIAVALEEKTARYGTVSARQLRSAVAFDDRETARETLDGVADDEEVVGLHLLGASGTELYSRGEPVPPGLDRTAGTTRRVGDRFIVAVPVVSMEGPRGSLVVSVSAGRLIVARHGVFEITGIAAALAAIAALFIAAPIGRRLSRRIRAVSLYATQVAEGDLDAQAIASTGNDEVTQTATAVQAMVAQLRGFMTAEAERATRFLLDQVNQGLLTVTYDGILVGEGSRAANRMLGACRPGMKLSEVLARYDPRRAALFDLGLAQVADGFLPLEVSLAQLPTEMTAGDLVLALGYSPVVDPNDPNRPRLLITITDITGARASTSDREEEEETIAVFRKLITDKHSVRRFFADGRAQIATVRSAGESAEVLAALHTLKGNAGLMGLSGWVRRCHQAESTIADLGELTADLRQELVWAWDATYARCAEVLRDDTIEISQAELSALARLATPTDVVALQTMLREVAFEPTARPLRQLAGHCRELAARYQRPVGSIVVDDRDVRLDPAWGPLWSVLAHVVRNVAAHGMRTEAPTTVSFRSFREAGEVVIEISDDGNGIDWDVLRERAVTANLAADTRDDLLAAMFSSGVTTRTTVDDTAGRGVGLAAVAATCRELGVRIEVISPPRGTTFRFHIPNTPPSSLSPLTSTEPQCVAWS